MRLDETLILRRKYLVCHTFDSKADSKQSYYWILMLGINNLKLTVMIEVQFIPEDTVEFNQKFLANNIQEDLKRFINPDVYIRFTLNSLQVFATDETENIWNYTYQL